MAPKRPLRKKYIIKPAYQVKLALVMAISFVLYSLVLAFILFYPLFRELQASVSMEEQARISNIVLYLHARLWPAVFIIAVLVGVQVIISSHRLFGPIYRFEMTLKNFLNGDFSQRIKLRKHDSLKETEALFNRVAEYLEDESTKNDRLHESIKTRLSEAAQRLVSGDDAQVAKARETLLAIIKELG
ncbi:MAG: hypothetical protein BMS9Abin23_0907 [Thermodesulfobacteriota bacterium]|nr:MAG: hypothetical protein BMS9Abin23_0907 [Thermodesulfobacteriota bacterium]